MSFDANKLYNLLPALYRIRDTEEGIRLLSDAEKSALETASGNLDEVEGPLKSLLTIIAEQVGVLEENLEQLYDDQFIETCSEWAISYIGALVGWRGLIAIPGAPFSQRGEVANTIGYRRRKGTASVVEQLARDVTGWSANVTEYFQLLAATQYMNHLRPQNLAFSGLRNWNALEYSNRPFDPLAHTADVRRIEPKRGKYNIQNIGIHLWRLQSYSSTKSAAYRVDDRRFMFDALGKNLQLFNLPHTEKTITQLATPLNVPIPLSRNVLSRDVDTYYGANKSLLIYENGEAVLPDEDGGPNSLKNLIIICNLADVLDGGGNPVGWANMPLQKIAIDPQLGRIAFPLAKPAPRSVHVSYHYGFSANMGGGEYGRAETFTQDLEPVIEVQAGVLTLQAALNSLATTGGVIEILDNEYYFETPVVKIAGGKTIELRAAEGSKPVLLLDGDMLVEGRDNAAFIINGILIGSGAIRLPLQNSDGAFNKLQKLRLAHCTLAPGSSAAFGGIAAQPPVPRLVVASAGTVVELEKCITGALSIFEGAEITVSNSIVDAADETNTAFSGLQQWEWGGVLRVENSTVIGKVYTRIMELASNAIFLAASIATDVRPEPVSAQRLQQGCVRFSYIPPLSRLPRPYRCQPATPAVASRVRPQFTSLRYGDAGYCQLGTQCAPEINTGADDESEMGAFHMLYGPQRTANLQTRLDEYLRFGLEAGIFYAT
jgi:hypothetical protein